MATELNIPLKERLKSIPELFGIRVNEEPHYEVIKKDGDFEIRQYPKLLVAKCSMQGISFDEFKEKSFEKLAAYIFEQNEEKKSIPMTSPVLEEHGVSDTTFQAHSPFMQKYDDNGGWTMAFILPHELTIETAPTPNDKDIILEVREPEIIASLSYSGNNTVEVMKEHERKLAEWLNKQPNIKTEGKFVVAQYDAPFVIPFLKKNEIHAKVAHLH